MISIHWARTLLVGIILAGCFAASYGSLLSLNTHTGGKGSQTEGIWNLPPILLSVLAGEFKGLLADYCVLEAGARMGEQIQRTNEGKYKIVNKTIDWNTIVKLFSTSQYLDPSFQQTYIMAQGWLPWEAGMVAEAQQILNTAALHRPWDWQPKQLIGFNTYYFLNDPGTAGKILLEAARHPNAPSYLAILGARLAQKGGITTAAIALIKAMLENKSVNDPDFDDLSDRLKALEGVAIIESALQSYRSNHGILPQSLDDLVNSGILTSLPLNPYNVPYCMNREGSIFFDNPACNK